MAICWATIHEFSVVYRRTTALRLLLVLVLIQTFFLSWLFICQQQNVPSSVHMALENKKLEEAHEKQNLELRTS